MLTSCDVLIVRNIMVILIIFNDVSRIIHQGKCDIRAQNVLYVSFGIMSSTHAEMPVIRNIDSKMVVRLKTKLNV